MRSTRFTSSRLRQAVVYGLLVTLVIIFAVELPSRIALNIPVLTILLPVVAFVTFAGGRWAGSISAVLVVCYAAYDLFSPEQAFGYTSENAARLLLFIVAALAMMSMMTVLRQRLRATEMQLRQQLEFSTAIDQSLDEGVYVLDQQGHVTHMNPAAERMLGWTEAELLGKTMHDAIHYQYPDGTPYPRDACAGLQVFRCGTTYRTEDDLFIHKDGTMFPVAYSSSPMTHDGEVVGAVVAFRDITTRKRAEEQLRSYSQLLDQAKVVVIATDLDGRIVEWNTYAERMYGWLRDEVLGQPITRITVAPLDRAPAEQIMAQVCSGHSWEGEFTVARKDGSLFPAHVTLSPILNTHGRPTGIIGVTIDISARKQAEQALHKSSEQLRLMNSQIPAHLWTTDRERRITSVSGSALAQQGRDPQQFVGKTLPELMGASEQHLNAIAAHRRVLGGESAEYELESTGRTFACRVEPLRDEQGAIVGCLGIALDITERTRMETALEVRARQQAAVAEFGQRALATPDLTALMDQAAVLVAQTLDVQLSKVLEWLPDRSAFLMRAGTGWKDGRVGHATLSADPSTHAGASLRSNSAVVVEDARTDTRFRHPALLVEHGVISTMSVVIQAREQPFGVLEADAIHPRSFSADDVNFLQSVANVLAAAVERKMFEEQLAQERAQAAQWEELDRLRRSFVLSVSHELRTPLTAARGGLGMLEMSIHDRLAADERAMLAAARRNIERLRMLIDDLLSYNQLAAGTLHLNRAPVDLRAVVSDALPVVFDLTHAKQQSLDLDLPHPLQVEADHARLVQVLTNVLAFVHAQTPAGTRIHLGGRSVDGEVVLSVLDDGSGISAEDVQSVFQQFHRMGTAEDSSGTGLAVAHEIVKLHGGRLEAGRFRDRGGIFQLALPELEATYEGKDDQ